MVFPPRTQHGIDIDNSGRVYCLQMMLARRLPCLRAACDCLSGVPGGIHACCMPLLATPSTVDTQPRTSSLSPWRLPQPDDNFAAHVRSGEQKAALEAEDLCTLLRVGCMDSPPGLITVKNNATAAEADAGCSSEHASPRFPGRLRGAAGGANGASTSHSSSRN